MICKWIISEKVLVLGHCIAEYLWQTDSNNHASLFNIGELNDHSQTIMHHYVHYLERIICIIQLDSKIIWEYNSHRVILI